MDKKRKYKRLKIRAVGEIQRSGKKALQKVRLGVVGLGGAEIFSDQDLKVGEHLKVKITILTKKGKNLEGIFPCEIRWAYPYNEGFLAGAQFDQVIDRVNNFDWFSYILDSEESFGSP